MAWDKVVAPAQRVKYLGILVDTGRMELSLPDDKLDRLCSLVREFAMRTHANKRQIMSLAGLLSHCTKVVRGRQTFSRQVINLANFMAELYDVICLPDWFKANLRWWDKFCWCFNGTASMISLADADFTIYTDSSLSGFGAWFGAEWFTGVWRVADHRRLGPVPLDNIELSPMGLEEKASINLLELWPVGCAVRRWGPVLCNRRIHIKSDNQQVVRMIRTGRSRCHKCMSWLRELFWLTFIFNIELMSGYIRSSDNDLADYLSRLSNPVVMGKCFSIFSFFVQGRL